MATISSGTIQCTCAPSRSTRTSGAASGSTPTAATTATVSAPTAIPAPARLIGGSADGRPVNAK